MISKWFTYKSLLCGIHFHSRVGKCAMLISKLHVSCICSHITKTMTVIWNDIRLAWYLIYNYTSRVLYHGIRYFQKPCHFTSLGFWNLGDTRGGRWGVPPPCRDHQQVSLKQFYLSYYTKLSIYRYPRLNFYSMQWDLHYYLFSLTKINLKRTYAFMKVLVFLRVV